MTWLAQHIRTTVFLPVPASSSATLWQAITGSSPENEIRTGPSSQAEGPFGIGRLIVVSQPPGRVDLVYSHPGDATPDLRENHVGEFVEALKVFSPIANAFVQAQPPAVRLAFGAHVHWPTSGREEAYELLPTVIKTLPLDLEDAREFSYRINRPRKSKVESDLYINRLSKWNAVRLSLMVTNMATAATERSSESHGVRLELDVSTPVERDEPLRAQTLESLLAELRDLAIEIAHEGDIR